MFRKSQAAQSDQVLYAEDLNVAYQHENVNMICKQYSKDLVSFFEWFLSSKVSIHLGEDKTKCIRLCAYFSL